MQSHRRSRSAGLPTAATADRFHLISITSATNTLVVVEDGIDPGALTALGVPGCPPVGFGSPQALSLERDSVDDDSSAAGDDDAVDAGALPRGEVMHEDLRGRRAGEVIAHLRLGVQLQDEVCPVAVLADQDQPKASWTRARLGNPKNPCERHRARADRGARPGRVVGRRGPRPASRGRGALSSGDGRWVSLRAGREFGSQPQAAQACRTAERANSSAASWGSGLVRMSSQSRTYSPRAVSQRAAAGESSAAAKSSGAGCAYAKNAARG